MDDRLWRHRRLVSFCVLLLAMLVSSLSQAGGGTRLKPIEWKEPWPFWREGQQQSGPAFGANLGWQTGAYGSDLSRNFNEKWWRTRLRIMARSGLRIARIWLFENGEGIWLRHQNSGIVGIRPQFMRNLKTVIKIGEEEGILFYWTLLNGNTSKGREFFPAQYNIQTNKYGDGDFFRRRVVKPIAELLESTPSTFAIDIINEVEGILHHGTANREQIRTFIRETTNFLHEVAPTIPVTASGGWHVSVWNVLNGLYSGLNLDFIDIHIYGIRGRIIGCKLMKRYLGDTPVLLGEYGPMFEQAGEANWYDVVADLTEDANHCGLVGALPWKLEDPYHPHHSMLTFGRPKWAPYMGGFFKLVGHYLTPNER